MSPVSHDLSIREAAGAADYAEVARLALDYARWFEAEMGHDFCFQGFDEELRSLNRLYARPRGNAWLAEDADGKAVGLIAVKDLGSDPDGVAVCEMKRLWVDPSQRGTGLGRKLAEISITWARGAGYRVMRLDTLQRMQGARAIYETLGFRPCAPYVHNPIEDVIFLELKL